MPISIKEIEETKLWVRRASVPSLLVHFTPAKNLPDILRDGYLRPRVSAVAVGDVRPIAVLREIAPIPWETHIPVPIPPTESHKFKRVLYPYDPSAAPAMDEMLNEGELELVDQSVFPEYGPELQHYTQMAWNVGELESVSLEPIRVRP